MNNKKKTIYSEILMNQKYANSTLSDQYNFIIILQKYLNLNLKKETCSNDNISRGMID